MNCKIRVNSQIHTSRGCDCKNSISAFENNSTSQLNDDNISSFAFKFSPIKSYHLYCYYHSNYKI